MQEAGTVPEWSMGDRLRKARTQTGMSVDEFAVQCLISAKSVNNYEGDKVKQRPLVVEKWSRVTGVDLNWLLYGTTGATPTPDPGPGLDPESKADRAALDRLTKAKLSRRHTGGRSTQRYLPAAA